MSTVTIWILIAVSTGYYNGGTVTVVARFANQAQCQKAPSNMPSGTSKSFCVEAQAALP